MRRSLCFFALLILSACSANTPTSTPPLTLTPQPTLVERLHPAPRSGHTLVYHDQLQMVLLAGGAPEEGVAEEVPGKMWGWDGQRWQIVNEDGPPRRDLGGVAYDSRRNRLVVYGGWMRSEPCDPATYEWDGQVWEKKDVPGPAACDHFSMVYDAARGKVVLYGGQDENMVAINETWEWDGEQWEKINTSNPPHRYHYALTYDSAHEKVLLFGGNAAGNLNDMWEWDGATWERIEIDDAPSDRAHVRMVFDSDRQTLLLIGGSQGFGSGLEFLGDTWVWDNAAWTEGSSAGPPARGVHALAYDPVRKKVVMFGGYGNDQKNLGDTWEWDGSQWTLVDEPASAALPTVETSPPFVAGQWHDMIYHAALGRVVLANGGPESGKPANDPLELWSWDGAQWTLLNADGPRWRNWGSVAYDSARDVLVVHGGLQDRSTRFDDTWEWDGRQWIEVTSAGPGGREGAGMVYDAARGKIVLFGGSVNLEVMGDTWEWDGEQWTQVSSSGPPARFPAAMVYDAARQKVLMYGGHFASGNAGRNLGDLWEWDGATWREIIIDGPTPGIRAGTQMVFDPQTDQVLLFSGGENIFQPDVWAWDGTRWEQIEDASPLARSGLDAVYDVARDHFVLIGGVDRPGGQSPRGTWEWDRSEWLCIDQCP